jgi:hypothetical protein
MSEVGWGGALLRGYAHRYQAARRLIAAGGGLMRQGRRGSRDDGGPVVDLLVIATVTRLAITDVWSGMSPWSPIARTAELLRQPDDSFSGSVMLEVGDGPNQIIETLSRQVPREVAAAFLRLLAAIQPQPGTYQPLCTHTDDFPRLGIILESTGFGARFYTESQGEDHVPWGLTVAGVDYTVTSAAPAQALRLLDPHVGSRELEAILERAERRR